MIGVSLRSAFVGPEAIPVTSLGLNPIGIHLGAGIRDNETNIMTLASGIEIPSQEIAELCRRYQVRELAVFGSAARGETHPGSDIDIMVEFHPDANLGWEFFELEDGLARIFGRQVALGTKRSLKPWVRQTALRDARV